MESQPPNSRVNCDLRDPDNPDYTQRAEIDTTKVLAKGNSVKSTNPFRKNEDVLSSEVSRVPPPEERNIMGVRKNTPVRAVFDDLGTAHSSITSRSTRSGQRLISNKNSDPAEEEDSIPLQTLAPLKRDQGYSALKDLSTSPQPVILPITQFTRGQDYLTSVDERFAVQGAGLTEPIRPNLPEQNQSILATIKNAFVSISSPSQAPWPRDRQSSENDQDLRSLENQDNDYEAEHAHDFSNYPSSAGPFRFPSSTPGGMHSSNVHTTNNGYPTSYQLYHPPASSPPIPMSTHPRKFPRLVSGSTEVSVREGSTVCNIVQHYAGSEGLEGDGSDFEQSRGARHSEARSRNTFIPRASGHGLTSSPPFHETFQPSGLQIRKQRKGEASGTTRTPAAHPIAVRDPDSNEFFDESTSDTANSTLPSLPRISHRNPYRFNQARGIQAHADSSHCVYEDSPFQGPSQEARLPLEREVSQALRRASGYSAYSAGSFNSSVVDYSAMWNHDNNVSFQPNMTGHVKGKGKEVARDPNDVGVGHIFDEEAKCFYDEHAIPADWINSRQGIRVPIDRMGSFSEAPPGTPIVGNPQQSGQQRSSPADDVNDWETVGESAFGLEYGHENGTGLIGGGVHRTGSSIANTSDEGTASIHFEDLDEFGSTERIAQHPANIEYSGDYRQRDLKSTKMPILMPVFNGHKVNGYMADSNRIRPSPGPAFFRPEPLTEAHRNPFNSTPPDVMPPARVAKPKGNMRSHLAPTNPRAVSSSQHNTQRDRSGTYRKPIFKGQSLRQASAWTDSYRQTGPSVSMQIHPFANNDNDRPSSWDHVMIFAKGGHVPGYREDGTRICDPFSPEDEVYVRELLDQEQNADNLTHPFGQNRAMYPGRDFPSSSRQAPGAFYQGLRAVSDQKRPIHPGQHDGAVKSARRQSIAKPNGKTSLRPLSLLNGRLPSTPLRNVSNQSDMLDSGDFVYRSPLAPPKRSTWQMLYSNSRLLELQRRADADGVYNSQSGISDSIEGLSRRHLHEAPRLLAKPRKVKNDSRAKKWKVKFSKTVLIICCFFPPLLILFALGKMDGLILWWSGGRFQRFGKAQKKWAGIVLCTEVFIIAVLLVTFLAWFFGKRRA
ncbi:uncharacterized protein RSE6_07600 [Rhynchosporium secalis]|uniref:Uncharacterized protein n=1 Tax=Rhynchosporium secalis TaxID=38038 RepID=A0A1E1MDF3_RHYSE|nr:uncharacterized protein RSE6_07600 [Rhynchosporium secalis]